ncbi:ArsB/NhaD family transporter [Patescibacteria group bacterium]|nr:ArsB/NhaD family transporter [Patescibacteria group bacterium]
MWLPVIIFTVILLLIIFEVFDKTVLASLGAVLMIILGIVDFDTAIASIEFDTIILLMSMMLLVEITKESELFTWLTVKMAKISKGNPTLIFLLFILTTAFLSSFLDNVTTIVLMVPVTVALVKGMGRDPKPYIIAEIFFSNIGGTLTLIGDPPNILIGGSTDISFFEFIENLWIPVVGSTILISGIILALHWKTHFKPIASDLRKLFLSHMLIKKITYKFLGKGLNKTFVAKSVFVIFITIAAFLTQNILHLNVAVIALSGAVLLLLLSSKEVEFEKTLSRVEWSTLLFFAGLFVMVGAIEHVGVLEILSDFISDSAGGSYAMLLMMVLWISGLISMVLNNIPFVALMIPVIFGIQAQLDPSLNPELLWWALSLGACFGGNATVIGASANVIGIDLAKKDGVHISFLNYMKYGLPLTVITLAVSSVYLIFRAGI